MKIRKGFVSNSSSSSYICEICEEEMGDYHYSCENGHMFCEDHLEEDDFKILKLDMESLKNNKPTNKDMTEDVEKYFKMVEDKKSEEEIVDEFEEWIDELKYEIPQSACPICNLTHIDDYVLNSYIFKRNNINKEDILKEIKMSFNSLEELNNEEKLKVHFRKIKLDKLKK
jgi:hypothetical protein